MTREAVAQTEKAFDADAAPRGLTRLAREEIRVALCELNAALLLLDKLMLLLLDETQEGQHADQ